MFTTANHNLFSLSIAKQPQWQFAVIALASHRFGLGEAYQFELTVSMQGRVDLAEFLGQSASLSIASLQTFDGIISSVFEEVTDSIDQGETLLHFTLVSPLLMLRDQSASRVFVHRTLNDIISEVLDGYHQLQYKIILKQQHTIDFLQQVVETDYDFLMRVFAYHGIVFSYDDNEWLFTDMSEELSKNSKTFRLPFVPINGHVSDEASLYELSESHQLLGEKVFIRDYDDQNPTLYSDVSGESRHDGLGIDYRYGDNPEQVIKRQRSLDAKRCTLTCKTQKQDLQINDVITIAGYSQQRYRITHMQITGSAAQAEGTSLSERVKTTRFEVSLSLLPIEEQFHLCPDRFKKPILGNNSAVVEGAGDMPLLDDAGRYQLRFKHAPTHVSHPIRLMQALTGVSQGMHFPLQAGAEVLVTYINGDMDKPVMLGVLPNPEQVSPVTSQNICDNILKSWGGNQLRMDDKASGAQISLQSKQNQQSLILDATTDKHRIQLSSQQGDVDLCSGKSTSLKSLGELKQKIGKSHHVEVGARYQLSTKLGNIDKHAGGSIKIRADKGMSLLSESKSICFESAEHIIFDIKDETSLIIENKGFNLLVERGRVQLNAKSGIILQSLGSDIRLAQADGIVTLMQHGELQIKGPSVCFDANEVNMQGRDAFYSVIP